MRLIQASTVLSLLVVGGIVIACGDDDAVTPTPTGNDAGTSAVDGGTGSDSGSTPDGSGGACANLAGVYGITGTCTTDVLAPPKILCVRQKECSFTAKTEAVGQIITGTATNTGFTATTETPVHEDCSGTVADGALGTLECGAAGITCTMSGTRVAMPNAVDYCCDVVAQDCGAGMRCQSMGTTENLSLVSVCVPDRGTVDLNGTCTRASTATADIGNDDCKKGLFCANTGQASTTTRICRKLCRTNTDCTTAGEACFGVGAIDAGFCMARCSIFGSTGTACGTNNTCRIIGSFESDGYTLDQRCDFVGAGAAGATCAFHSDCAAGLGCNDSGKCAAYCDGAHACTTGTCKPRTGKAVAGYDTTTGLCN